MTQRNEHAPIVVGVDASTSAQEALDWAAAEASNRHRPLHIVHGFIWPLMAVPLGPADRGPPDGGFQNAAERLLAEAEMRARATAPDVKVTTELSVGAATQALLEQAQNAELVVVGSRGLGGFVGLLVGSVGVALAAHAPCPVVVVRPHPGDHTRSALPTGKIVVGVDGSDLSADATRFAFQMAARRGARLTAANAWTSPNTTLPAWLDPVHENEKAARQLLDDALEVDRQEFPDVDVEAKSVRSHPGRIIVKESAAADLVVVGSRGRGGFQGLLLGSVSQAVLHHADCPVAIVRPHR